MYVCADWLFFENKLVISIGLNGSANGSVAKSEHGLSLSLSLDATTYQPDQEISMVVDEENTLSSTNDVPSSQDYRLNTLTLSECGMEFYPFGVSIFQGQYTLLTLPKTMPLCYMTLTPFNTVVL